jgi:hypothetical protein
LKHEKRQENNNFLLFLASKPESMSEGPTAETLPASRKQQFLVVFRVGVLLILIKRGQKDTAVL